MLASLVLMSLGVPSGLAFSEVSLEKLASFPPLNFGFSAPINVSLSTSSSPKTCQADRSQAASGSERLVYKYDKVAPQPQGTPFRDGFLRHSCHPHPTETEAEPYCLFSNTALNNGSGMVVLATASTLESSLDSHLQLSEEPPSTNAINVVSMPEKGGMGALAAHRLEFGERVIYARASLLVSVDEPTWGREDWKHVRKLAVDLLPLQTRAAIARLHGVGEREEEWISSTIDMNSFEIKLGEKSDVPFFALMPAPARLNHDCRPNTAFYVDNDTLEVHMRTLRPIHAGEELTISYRDMSMSRAERQHEIEHYGFTCTCAHCQMSEELVEESDRRIEMIQELSAKLLDINEIVETSEADELVELYELEHLGNTISDAYTIASLVYNSLGHASQARRYATKALAHGLVAAGPKWEEVDALKLMAEDPKAHWSFRARLDL